MIGFERWMRRRRELDSNKTQICCEAFPPDARYLDLAFPAGAIPSALLHWLVNLGYKRLIVCHFNHQLRGRSSDADARFVEKLVERYNQELVGRRSACQVRGRASEALGLQRTADFEFELGSANVRALGKKQKMSIETAAREARYAFFAESRTAPTLPERFFVAHHADDLVETFLINLFRGAGSAGLCCDARSFYTANRRCRSDDRAAVALVSGAKRSTTMCASIG